MDRDTVMQTLKDVSEPLAMMLEPGRPADQSTLWVLRCAAELAAVWPGVMCRTRFNEGQRGTTDVQGHWQVCSPCNQPASILRMCLCHSGVHTLRLHGKVPALSAQLQPHPGVRTWDTVTQKKKIWLQAMQGLLVEWLERFSALLEPTEMETAMWDEVNLTLASILAAEVSSSSANILRELGNAQSARLTAARMCLIQNVHTHGESAGYTACVHV